MIASTTMEGRTGPTVTVSCNVPGGPWFVDLGGAAGLQVQLGPYENPAIAREDAAKLVQFLSFMIATPPTPTPAGWSSAVANSATLQESGPRSETLFRRSRPGASRLNDSLPPAVSQPLTNTG
jgi:hypothetical protein